jgi:hypothetical protein
MNHQLQSNYTHDQESFKNIKTQFGVLKKELQDIYEEWGKINHGPPDKDHRLRQKELADHESKILGELRRLLRSADEVLGRTRSQSETEN